MSCSTLCGCMVPVGVMVDYGLPKQLVQVFNNLKERGANTQAEAIFTFFWNNLTDLDIWVRHKETGEFVSFENKNNSTLGLTLDVDANGPVQNNTTSPIENIGVIQSSRSPDGTYEVYLDNYRNREHGNNFFNILVAFKNEGETIFTNVAWYRNAKSFDPPQYAGDFSQMLRVLDVIKTGNKYRLANLTTTLEEVYLTKKFVVE